MEYYIEIGSYRLVALDSVSIKRGVESLSDVATIVLPATNINRSIEVESKIKEGDAIEIRLGYGDNLQTEFKGYLKSIRTDDNKITLECEDEIYVFRKGLENREYKDITLEKLLTEVVSQIDNSYSISCDYEFRYDKFVIRDANAWDVLKKVQDETKANIYFKEKCLHVHPQYSEIANESEVIFDFSVNIEKSNLKYKKADERKYFVEVEGVGKDGKRISTSIGTTGGEKRSIKIYGVTDTESLKKRAKEELKQIVYTGFEGDFTCWLVPYVEPTYKIELRDSDYPEKNGKYYVLATDTSFSRSGGVRKIRIGKKL